MEINTNDVLVAL